MKLFIFALLVGIAMASEYETGYPSEYPTEKRHLGYGGLGYGGLGYAGYGGLGYGGRFGYGGVYPGYGLGYGGVWKRETPRNTPYESNFDKRDLLSSFDGQTGYPTSKLLKRDVESSYEVPTEKRHLAYPGGLGYGYGGLAGYGGHFGGLGLGYGAAYPGFGLGYGGVWKRETPRTSQYESNFDRPTESQINKLVKRDLLSSYEGQTSYPSDKLLKRDLLSSFDGQTSYPVDKLLKRDLLSSYEVPTEKRHLAYPGGLGYGYGGLAGYGGHFGGLGLGYGAAYPAAGFGLGYGGVWKRETPRDLLSSFDSQTGYPTSKLLKRDVESSYDYPLNTQVPTEKRHLLLGGYGLGGYGGQLGYGGLGLGGYGAAYPAAGYGYGYPGAFGYGRGGVLLK